MHPRHGTILAMPATPDPEERRVRLPGGWLAYWLRRSARSRTLRVTIDPRRGVVVSVPLATRRGWARPEREVERFLADREGWIRRHVVRQERLRAVVRSRGGVADGAEFRYLGELHRLRLVAAAPSVRRSVVERSGAEDRDELLIQLARRDRRSAAVVLEAWLRERAGDAIDRAVAAHAPALRVQPERITLRDPRTRWGSATRQRTLSFSWRLILAPPSALETVVVHELAHLRVFGHGPRFWDLVAARRPDHLLWRRWLRLHSHELHAALDAPDAEALAGDWPAGEEPEGEA
ncbi:MAG: family peptidase [Chloroflexi bacterium]|nr:family peptidase [Chloroflexota bacterium]